MNRFLTLSAADQRMEGMEGVDRVTVKTFHAFGRDVIATSQGAKPAVASWVGSRHQENETIVEIVEDLRSRDPNFGIEWDMFRAVFGRPIGRPADLREPQDGGRGDILTANGDWVKSQEELLIANWLFYHGVHYRYEQDYEHDTRTTTHQQYRPDFYYPDANLYHEHFALGHDGMPPPHFSGDYLGGVVWKRALHAAHETELFETTSHGLRSGGFRELTEALLARGVEPVFDLARPAKAEPPMDTLALANLVRGFQQHVKGGGATVADIRRRIEAVDGFDAHSARSLSFLSLYERIAEEWERRLDLLLKNWTGLS